LRYDNPTLIVQETALLADMTSEHPKRKDLVNNFPSSYTYRALCTHFTSEFKKVLGYEAPKPVFHTLTVTFMRLWKTTRKKELFFSKPFKKLVGDRIAFKEEYTSDSSKPKHSCHVNLHTSAYKAQKGQKTFPLPYRER
jgi:hypothetical protein